MKEAHLYVTELIRGNPDPFKRKTIIELTRTHETYEEAYRTAINYGAVNMPKRTAAPRIEGAAAVWDCSDIRFCRVQIRIVPNPNFEAPFHHADTLGTPYRKDR